jgi:Cu/Zn superoxide dismutase
MRYIIAAAGISGVLLAVGAAAKPATTHARADELFTAQMNGTNEQPAPVSTDASGTAEFTVTPAGIRYRVTVSNLSSPPTSAHIHGPGGANASAGVLVPFNGSSKETNGEIASGVITSTSNSSISLDSLKALMRAGQVYAQVHTTKNPQGEIRGQVHPKANSMP